MKSFQSLEKYRDRFSNHWKIRFIVCGAWLGVMLFSAAASAEEVASVTSPVTRICYLIPSNRTAQTNGVLNIQRSFMFYREWVREQQELNGYGARTFSLETEADGWTPKVYVVETTNTDSYLASNMWSRCIASAQDAGVPVWATNQIWVVFSEAHIMETNGSITGHYCGGTGDDHNNGAAVVSGDILAMLDPVYLTNDTAYSGLVIPEVGAYPAVYGVTFDEGESGSLSDVGSVSLGTCLHEFLHGFRLHHDFRNDWTYYGNIMGNGLRGMRGYVYPSRYTNNFTRQSHDFSALLDLSVMLHPEWDDPVVITPSFSILSTGVVPVVNGKAELNMTAHGFYELAMAVLIPVGGYGEGVVMGQALSGTSNTVEFLTPYYTTNQVWTNEVRVSDIYGNRNEAKFVFSVSGVTNQCPYSNIKIFPPMPSVGEEVTFDASGSVDPDGDLSGVTVEWDFNNDDVYDTEPMPCTNVCTTNYAAYGLYQVKVRLKDGNGGVWISMPVGVRVGMTYHYVWTNSPSPQAPYTAWSNAAHAIQDAVDASVDGDIVLAAPGVYDAGGRTTPGGSLTNRICITNAVTVRSACGPDQTILAGDSSGGAFGASAVRCAYVGTNGVLDGFTLSGGWTLASGDTQRDQSGGGALVIGGCLTNCRITGCSAYLYGGGAAMYYGGRILNSTLESNIAARGGGADIEYAGITNLIQGCTFNGNSASNYGGGVYCRGAGLVAECLIFSNTAGRCGGGVHLAYTSRVENCAVYGNAATDTVTYGQGGGVMCEFNGGEVRSCTVADNTAGREGGGICMQSGTGTVINSILYFNTAGSGANWKTNGAAGARIVYTCTTPTNDLPGGGGCLADDPLFMDEAARNYQLSSNSPALDAGLNSAWASNAVDLAGNPRITGSAIDMGAYENPSLYTPCLITDPVTNIDLTQAEGGGEVVRVGSYPVTARGLCWSTAANPTPADWSTTNGSGTGVFSAVLTNLTPGATYHLRAYAVNAVGTGYGEERTFTTLGCLEDLGADLVNLQFSAAVWGDVDDDGDLDALISGYSGSANNTILYRNDGTSVFTQVTCGLPICQLSSLALGDYDRDGDLDVAICGQNAGLLTKLYVNDGTGVFSDSGVSLPGLYRGSLAWGDCDNDGDLDLLLMGSCTNAALSYRMASLYRNDNGAFTDMNVGLPGVHSGSAVWGDYDLDGDLDILLCGTNVNADISRIYRNDGGGVFTDIDAGLTGISKGNAAWGDYNLDGYLDILLSGSGYSLIYRNNGNGTFSDISAGLPGMNSVTAAWGDYDNDGDPDVLLSGYDGDSTTVVYRNDNGIFTEDTDVVLQGVYGGDAVWGDYDLDGRIDLLLTGYAATSGCSRIYHNLMPGNHATPAAPTGLTAVTNGLTMVFSWTADAVSTGCTYNLRIGSTEGTDDIMPAMADMASGRRLLPGMGNAGCGTSCTFEKQPGGTSYYWSVQVLNAAWNGGPWTDGGSFTIPCAPVVSTAPPSKVTLTTASCGGEVIEEGDSSVISRGCVWSTNAHPTVDRHDGMTTNGSGTGVFVSELTGLTSGGVTYYVRAYAANESGAGYGSERTFTTCMTPPGRALGLDGTNDYVTIPDADELDMTNNYTLECWFRPDGFGTLRGLISKYQTAGAYGYFLRLNTNDLVFDQMTTSNLNLLAGCWYHAAVVNSNGTRILYLNGMQQTLYGTPQSVSNNSNTLRLGSDFGGRYFDGEIDEVRIWNTVRTLDEIRDSLYTVLSGSETGLVAYYRCDALEGTILNDSSDHNHNGTLVNEPAWTTSTIPCAVTITNRIDLSGSWSGQTNSLPSGRFSLTNGVFPSDAYVLFGHDDGTNDWVMSDLPPGMKRRLGRVWQTEGVGTSVVAVALDVTGMEVPDASQLRLLYSTNGTFSDGATLATGSLDGAVFTVTEQTNIAGRYCTLGEYYGVWYVDAARPDDGGDGMSWATAKRTIQAAVNLASSYDTIWVTNGIYDEGGAVADGYSLTGRVVVAKTLYLRSMNGADETFIVGASDNGTNGPSAIRCVWMSAGVLEGFTLTNGFTMSSAGDWNNDRGGGGLCLDGDAVVSNCVITGCSAGHGGGVNFLGSGLLDRSTVEGCHSSGQAGGLYLANGGTALCCVVRGNWAYNNNGGGAYLYFSGLLRNCLFTGNISSNNGGGVLMDCGGLIQNCTFTDNRCYGQGGGVSIYLTGTVENSILYGNLKDAIESNYNTSSVPTNVFIYSLAVPLPAGAGNIATNPLWVAASDYHLQADSSCRNAGTNQSWMTNAVDLDGASRLIGGTVDMGCYEYTNEPTLVVLYDFHLSEENGQIWVCWETASEMATAFFDLYRWTNGEWIKVNESPILSQGVESGMGASYCVPDSAADATNTFRYKLVETETDGTTEEYGPFDVAVWSPRMENISVTTNGVIIRWLSREQDLYEVQRVNRLGESFLPIATNIPPTPPVNIYTDEVQQSSSAYYRVRVE